MDSSNPISIRVEFRREQEPARWHAVAYIPGSPKTERRTLCGVPRSDLSAAASFEPGDTRNPFFTASGCGPCRQGLAI